MPSSQTYFRRGEEHHGAKLTDERVKYILRSPLGLNDLARMFGVDKGTIWRVQVGRTWRHVTGRNGGNP